MTPPKKRSILSLVPFVDVLERMNYPSRELLAKHNLDLDVLTASATIRHEDELAIIQAVLEDLTHPLLGVDAGRSIPFSSYGIYMLFLMSSPTIRDCTLAAIQFRQLSYAYSEMSLHLSAEYAELRLIPPDKPQKLRDFIVDRDFMAAMRFTLEIHEPKVVEAMTCGIARRAPANVQRYLNDLPIKKARFNEPYTWVRLPIEFLNTPMRHGSAMAHQFYEAQAQEALKRLDHTNLSLTDRVHLTLDGFEREMPTMAQVAEGFGMSDRSLRRKLKALGTSYRELLEQHQFERALRLLSLPTYRVEDVAEKLGYRDPVSFAQAFKRWSGLTPTQYLRSLQ